MTQQVITILIGPPCCGKSHYVKHHQPKFDFVMSSDNIVTSLCEENNLHYGDFFQLPMSHPIRRRHNSIFKQNIELSKQHNQVVWDLTSLTIKDRARIMSHYSAAEFIAVEFSWLHRQSELFAINEQRGVQQNKHIPQQVLVAMFGKYQAASLSEGFSSIIKHPYSV